MARIKIVDLPKDMKVSREDMKKITGGVVTYNRLPFNAPTFNTLTWNAPRLNDTSTVNPSVVTVPGFVP